MLVILPLITGGALQGALRKMGVQMPAALAGLGGLGGAAKGFGGDGYSGRSESSGGGGIDLGQVVNIAKMFM